MKKFVYIIFSIILASAFLFSLYRYSIAPKDKQPKAIKVGILHSLTGATSADEKQMVHATLLAIEEINEKGGALGAQLVPVIADGKSDPQTFAQEAERLLNTEKVAVIFGCWTSNIRKQVLPIVEKNNSLLFYPGQYAGLELSPNIVYTGSVPNQQILPGVRWSYDNLGKKFFLVGSDYIYPHAANKIMKAFIQSINAELVGEEYLPLGTQKVQAVINKIITSKPTVILNTLVGNTNTSFFTALRKAGIPSEKIPTISFGLSESDITQDNLRLMVGDYICGSYFQNITNEQNTKFTEKFTKKYGKQILLSEAEAAYFGPHLWAQAVDQAKNIAVDSVRSALKNQAYFAPEGIVHIDPETQHAWKYFRIGKIRFNGEFNIFWESYKAIKPLPYPTMFGSKESWDQFVDSLYKLWGNQWENPKK